MGVEKTSQHQIELRGLLKEGARPPVYLTAYGAETSGTAGITTTWQS